MKKKVLTYSLSIIYSLLFFFACDNGEGPDTFPPYNSSFIQTFTSTDQVSVEHGFGVRLDEQEKCLYFSDANDNNLSIRCEFSSPNGLILSRSQEYKQLVNEIGDNVFNRRERYYGVLGNNSMESTATKETFASVVITCDKQYNANFPANTSLNSIITVFYDDYYGIVKNKYQNYRGEDAYSAKVMRDGNKTSSLMQDGFPYAFIGKKMSEMDWETKNYIGNICLFLFTEKPDVADTYTFTIRTVKSDGKVLEATTEPIIFTKGKNS